MIATIFSGSHNSLEFVCPRGNSDAADDLRSAMTNQPKICFLASEAPEAQTAKNALVARYGNAEQGKAGIIVALGGDGFMLSTLHAPETGETAVYGMNCGTVGFLMNEYNQEGLFERLGAAEAVFLNPLCMDAVCEDGRVVSALAINEVSLYRAGAQAAKLRVSVDGRVRMEELVCDGALVATPAGSTAYNYSAHGPVLPIDAGVLALTPVAAFRPRRWRGALLPQSATVRFDVLEPAKRPVSAVADSRDAKNVVSVEIRSEPRVRHHLLFDPGHGLEERLTREQFT